MMIQRESTVQRHALGSDSVAMATRVAAAEEAVMIEAEEAVMIESLAVISEGGGVTGVTVADTHTTKVVAGAAEAPIVAAMGEVALAVTQVLIRVIRPTALLQVQAILRMARPLAMACHHTVSRPCPQVGSKFTTLPVAGLTSAIVLPARQAGRLPRRLQRPMLHRRYHLAQEEEHQLCRQAGSRHLIHPRARTTTSTVRRVSRNGTLHGKDHAGQDVKYRDALSSMQSYQR